MAVLARGQITITDVRNEGSYTFVRYSDDGGKTFTAAKAWTDNIMHGGDLTIQGDNAGNYTAKKNWTFDRITRTSNMWFVAVVKVSGQTLDNGSIIFQTFPDGGLSYYRTLGELRNVSDGVFVIRSPYNNIPEMTGDGVIQIRLDNVDGLVKVSQTGLYYETDTEEDRNFVQGAADESQVFSFTGDPDKSYYHAAMLRMPPDRKVGDKFILSAEVKLEAEDVTNVWILVGVGLAISESGADSKWNGIPACQVPTSLAGKGWSKVSRIIEITSDNVIYATKRFKIQAGRLTGTLQVRNIQLKRGDSVTTWTPAPEDCTFGTTTGKYMGTAVWDKPYPPLDPSDYTWSEVQGRGVASIVRYFGLSNSEAMEPKTYDTTPKSPTPTARYLWGYDLVTYTDGTAVQMPHQVIAVHGDKGDKGDKGVNGKDGVNGTDAVNIIPDPAQIIVDTDDEGLVTNTEGAKSVIRAYRGGNPASVTVKSVSTSNGIGASFNGATVKLERIGQDPLTQYAYATGWVDVTAVVEGKEYPVRLTVGTNIHKLTHRLELSDKQREETFEEFRQDYEDNNNRINTEFTKIRQDAKEIALEQITKTTGRDNLLVGSAFRNENEIEWYNKTDPTLHKCRISRTVNCLGTNSVMIESTSTADSFLGVAFWGIQVNAGGTYNVSCQIFKEANVDTGTVRIEVKCYRKDKSLATVFVPFYYKAATEDNKWTLNQLDFTVGDDVDYIDVFFWVGKAGRFYLARPMLREGEGYTKWSLSQFDYGYIGGNMLDGTKNFDGAHINVNKGSKGSYDGNVTKVYSSTANEYFLSWYYPQGLLNTDTDYVLSFVAKGNGVVGTAIYGGNNKTVFSEGSDGSVIPFHVTAHGEQKFNLTGNFRRYWVRVRTGKSFDDNQTFVGFRTYDKGVSIELYNVKLEVGATDTGYTDSSEKLVSEDMFTKAGIYLKEGKIVLDAKNTIVKENLTTKRLRTTPTYAGGPYAEIYGSEFLIMYGNRKKGAQFGIGDDGLLHLIFFDANGKAVGDLGPGGWSKLVDKTTEAKWTELRLKDITGSKNINDVINVKQRFTTAYYRFTAARNSELNIVGDNAEYDNQVFKTSGSFTNKISDGWYIPPNEGSYKSLPRPSDPYLPGGDTSSTDNNVYFTHCYHYVSGKLVYTVTIYFINDRGLYIRTDRNGNPIIKSGLEIYMDPI